MADGAKSPRDAAGATVHLTAGGFANEEMCRAAIAIYLNDMRLTSSIDSVEIHWPSGAIERLTLPGADRIYTVTEGKGILGQN